MLDCVTTGVSSYGEIKVGNRAHQSQGGVQELKCKTPFTLAKKKKNKQQNTHKHPQVPAWVKQLVVKSVYHRHGATISKALHYIHLAEDFIQDFSEATCTDEQVRGHMEFRTLEFILQTGEGGV